MSFSNLVPFTKTALVTAALGATLLLPQISNAQVEIPQGSGYARALIGVAKPKDVDARLGFGGEIGLKFTNDIAVGAVFLASTGNNVKLFDYGLAGDYYFDQQAPGLRAGALIGANTAKVSTPVGSGSSTHFMVGPRLGYDYMVAAPLSIGVEVSFPIIFGDSTAYTLYGLASVRYVF